MKQAIVVKSNQRKLTKAQRKQAGVRQEPAAKKSEWQPVEGEYARFDPLADALRKSGFTL